MRLYIFECVGFWKQEPQSLATVLRSLNTELQLAHASYSQVHIYEHDRETHILVRKSLNSIKFIITEA